jgi:hypothetical protein
LRAVPERKDNRDINDIKEEDPFTRRVFALMSTESVPSQGLARSLLSDGGIQVHSSGNMSGRRPILTILQAWMGFRPMD